MIELGVMPADLEKINSEELSSDVRNAVEIHPNDPIIMAFVVRHEDVGAKTYVVQGSDHIMNNRKSGGALLEFSVVDVLYGGNAPEVITGNGEVGYTTPHKDKRMADEDDGKAFVRWSATKDDYQRRGLGRRRLLVMNAASQLLHDSVLHSGSPLSTEARRLWQKLVDEGLAEPFWRKLSRNESYRFLR